MIVGLVGSCGECGGMRLQCERSGEGNEVLKALHCSKQRVPEIRGLLWNRVTCMSEAG